MFPTFYLYYSPLPLNQPYFYYQTPPMPYFPSIPHEEPPVVESTTPVKVEQESSSVGELTRPKAEENAVVDETTTKISRFKYPKKNVESNVVNQVISFISTKAKSKTILQKLLVSEEKVETFYEIMKQVKRKHVRYVGRAVLQSLLEADEDHQVYILHKRLKISRTSLRISQIRKALRALCNYFLRNLMIPTVLTSSKLDKTTVNQHLVRAREIFAFINNRPPPYAN